MMLVYFFIFQRACITRPCMAWDHKLLLKFFGANGYRNPTFFCPLYTFSDTCVHRVAIMALFFSNGEKPWRDFWHSLVKEHLSNYKVICVVNCDHRVHRGAWWNHRLHNQGTNERSTVCHRLNMESDLQSLFGLLCTAVLIGWDPGTPPLPPHLGSYTSALLVSQDRRHLFVTPWSMPSRLSLFKQEDDRQTENRQIGTQTRRLVQVGYPIFEAKKLHIWWGFAWVRVKWD